MSHAYGEVHRDGAIIGHFEYDGTSDYARAKVWSSSEETKDNWRRPQPMRCSCEGVPVQLVAHYGSGLRWDSRICEEHRFIVGNSSPYKEYEEE